MSATRFPNAPDENELLQQASDSLKSNEQLKKNVDPAVAARIGEIYRANPWMKPGEILALAKAGASQQVVDKASELSATAAQTRLDPDNQKKNWFQRNVSDKVKATSRWTFAALNLAPELTQNIASQAFSKNDPDGFDGWFKSTTLGSLIDDPNNAGEGYFASGAVAEKQAERARRVRGTINGSAWTVGRGAADLVFVPGSREYNFLSGFIDAAVNIYSDPTMYAGQALQAARAGGDVSKAIRGTKTVTGVLAEGLTKAGLVESALMPTIKGAEEISAFARAAERGIAGLTDAEKMSFESSKFYNFFNNDSRARRLVGDLVNNDDAFDILSRVFKYKIDPEYAGRLAEAKTTDQIVAIIGEATDRVNSTVAGLIPEDIRRIPGATRAEWVKERIPLYNSLRNSRLLTKVPDSVIIWGSSQDRTNAVRAIANYLDTANVKTSSEKGRAVMREVMDIARQPGKVDTNRIQDLYNGIIEEQMVQEFGDASGRKFAKSLFDRIKERTDETRKYFVDAAGDMFDGNFIKSLIDSGLADIPEGVDPAQLDKWVMSGPASLVELMDNVQILPDPRQLRRLTGNPFVRRIVSNPEGDPRGAIAITEWLQNDIWKPLTLATGGYIMRNLFEGQVRLATVGKASFFRHPWEYIQWAMSEKGATNIFGKKWDEIVTKTANEWDDVTDDWAEVMSNAVQANLTDPVEAIKLGVKTKSFKIADKAEDPTLWFRGLIEELGQVSTDRISNALAKGIPADEIIASLRSSDNPKDVAALKALTNYLKNGVPIKNRETGIVNYFKVENVTDEVLAEWVDKLAGSRLAIKTGGNERLKFALGYRMVPNGAQTTIDPKTIDATLHVLPGGPKKLGKGSLINIPGTGEMAIVTDASNPSRWAVQGVSGNDIWNTPEGQREFADFVAFYVDDPSSKLPQKVKYAERKEVTQNLRKSEDIAIRAKNRFVDFFFNNIAGKVMNTLERSPAYRQEYYQQIVNNADLLSKDEAGILLQRIKQTATANEMSMYDVVGGKANWKKLEEKLATGGGTGTMQQLDQYASIRATNFVKDELFNATERNNLEDILRIVMPFGVAYREVLQTYVGYLVENPARIRRAQQVYTGMQNFDPDQDGRGFFYKDPVTGENMFTFPFSGKLSKLITGQEAPLVGRVKGLSMGFQVLPAVGPAVQIAASKVIPDTPSTDALVEFLLPYGRKGVGAFVPGYVAKIKDAIEADPNKLNTIYGNTYVETVQALSASGRYDLKDVNEKQRLFEEAKPRAQALAIMRALSQFLGPTAGTTEFIVPTSEGDVMASALVAQFHKLQNENPDTAVETFIRRFGDDALLYVSGKTKATVGGLSASQEFADWQRGNKDLFKKYPKVAAYFAPGGDDFSFSAWERQIRTGQRVRLTEAQMVDLAQYRIGAAIYRDLKSQIGQYPNKAQREWLAEQRVAINKEYPGFPAVAVFTVGEFDQKIKQMQDAVNDEKLQKNPVALALSDYLKYRDQAYQQVLAAGNKDISGKKFIELRQWLYNIGEALTEETPDFARIWDELSSEVD
jgi:hypothetical protein